MICGSIPFVAPVPRGTPVPVAAGLLEDRAVSRVGINASIIGDDPAVPVFLNQAHQEAGSIHNDAWPTPPSDSETSPPELYSHATWVVMPSVDEGFWLPPPETMACGTPVIACANSSLPLGIGDAGLPVDPHSVGVANAISWVLRDLRRELGEHALSPELTETLQAPVATQSRALHS
jgi:glycosyltransferase involved in cell wall biosynthesis